jgi:hypothetical protein
MIYLWEAWKKIRDLRQLAQNYDIVQCPSCGSPVDPKEMGAYDGQCEDCWAQGIRGRHAGKSVSVIRTKPNSKHYGADDDMLGRDIEVGRRMNRVHNPNRQRETETSMLSTARLPRKS